MLCRCPQREQGTHDNHQMVSQHSRHQLKINGVKGVHGNRMRKEQQENPERKELKWMVVNAATLILIYNFQIFIFHFTNKHDMSP